MEALADFGTGRVQSPERDRPERENPINTFNIEYMKDMLCERTLGPLQPYSRFVNEVMWGNGPGSIRIWVDPKSGVYLDRLGVDLSGERRWYTKKYYQINRQGYGGYEEVVTHELFDRLSEVYEQPPESPKSDYKELNSLVISMAGRIRKESRPIFLFDKIHKLNENRYLISLNLRGQGVQQPGQSRAEKNITDVSYHPNEGYIRVINYMYSSPLGEHKWAVSGPDQDVCYFPTQSRDEIIDPVVTNLRFY